MFVTSKLPIQTKKNLHIFDVHMCPLTLKKVLPPPGTGMADHCMDDRVDPASKFGGRRFQ